MQISSMLYGLSDVKGRICQRLVTWSLETLLSLRDFLRLQNSSIR